MHGRARKLPAADNRSILRNLLKLCHDFRMEKLLHPPIVDNQPQLASFSDVRSSDREAVASNQ